MKSNEKKQETRVEAVNLTIRVTYTKGSKPRVEAKLKHRCMNEMYALQLITQFVKHRRSKKGDA